MQKNFRCALYQQWENVMEQYPQMTRHLITKLRYLSIFLWIQLETQMFISFPQCFFMKLILIFQEIGQVADVQTCQELCKDLYTDDCEWFIYDRTTKDCRLFQGSMFLAEDCREIGYYREPKIEDCEHLWDSDSENACYVRTRL